MVSYFRKTDLPIRVMGQSSAFVIKSNAGTVSVVPPSVPGPVRGTGYGSERRLDMDLGVFIRDSKPARLGKPARLFYLEVLWVQGRGRPGVLPGVVHVFYSHLPRNCLGVYDLCLHVLAEQEA